MNSENEKYPQWKSRIGEYEPVTEKGLADALDMILEYGPNPEMEIVHPDEYRRRMGLDHEQ